MGAGGNTYEGSDLVSVYSAAGAASLSSAVLLGKTHSFYFDSAGFVVYAEEDSPPAQYLMLLAVAAYSGLDAALEAKALLDDGSEQIIDIVSLTASGTTISVAERGALAETTLKAAVINPVDITAASPKIYSYTQTPEGSYRLVEQPTDYSTTKIISRCPTLSGSGLLANADTRFVLSYGAGCRVFRGIEAVPTVDTSGDSAYCFTYGTGGTAEIAFLLGAASASLSSDVYLLSTDPTVTLENERLVYRYTVLLDGAATSLEVTGAAKADAFSRTGLVANVFLDLDGAWQIDAQVTPAAADAASLCENGVIRGPVMQASAGSTAWSMEYLSCNERTKLYLIDGDAVTQASLDDVVAIASYPSASSKILIVRASHQTDSPDYNVAGTVYLVK